MDSPQEMPACASARVLNYNFNILPRGCGGFQSERIDTFLSYVDQYDVLILQEVYSTSVLPYVLQKRFCCQKLLLDGLRKRGFHYYVISRQPRYKTMLQYSIISDNGLIIASRYPIWHRGSYTFRSRERGEQSVLKGCLFAEVDLPVAGGRSERVVFFNVHLRSELDVSAEISQAQEMRRFVESVMHQLQDDEKGCNLEDKRWLPFVIAGDFNVDGIGLGVDVPVKKLSDMMSELQSLGSLREIVLDTYGNNQPTRPAKLFFPTRSKLVRYQAKPQRQDYFFINERVTASSVKIEKFVVSRRRPYTYLSDHFGISARVEVPVTEACATLAPRKVATRLQVSSLADETLHEKSDPTSTSSTEVLLAIVLAWLAITVSWKPLLLCAFVWAGVWWFRYSVTKLDDERMIAASPREGAKDNGTSRMLYQPRDPLEGIYTLRDAWERSALRYRNCKCLGTLSDVGNPEWLSFGTVDTHLRELSAGLSQLGLRPGDVIGVAGEASRKIMFLELTCAFYGYTTLSLVGNSSTIGDLLDRHHVRVAFSSRSSIATILTSRSSTLTTIVYLHPFVDEEDESAAKDLTIALLPYEAVEHKGSMNSSPMTAKVSPSTVLTYTVENASSGNSTAVTAVTHEDVLRAMRTMIATGVLPSSYTRDVAVSFLPFPSVLPRIFALGLLVYGNAVASTGTTALQEAFKKFKPTLLATPSSLFANSYTQLNMAKQRYSTLYHWLFDRAYHFRSHSILVNGMDSSMLRLLFFRSFQEQLGGSVRGIVLLTAQETTPFELLEYISVCYAPRVHEVAYQSCVGIFAVDGVPSSELKVALTPMDDLSESAKIGLLTVAKGEGEPRCLGVAARWERHNTLTMLGSPAGILWPVDYEYVISDRLESTYANSRFVNDIFVYCEPLKPIIAVVYPNRDTLEFEWQQSAESGSTKQAAWTDLVAHSTRLILHDFASIAQEAQLHASQIPQYLHLHPHSFKDHSTFLTPFGLPRRENIKKYFAPVFERLYNHGVKMGDEGTEGLESYSMSSETDSFMPEETYSGKLNLRVPISIDIGGTFAKMAFIMPPGVTTVAPFITTEASSLSDRLGLRTFRFFPGKDEAAEELQRHPRSRVGTLRFAKLPSKQIPNLADFLVQKQVMAKFHTDYTGNIRATGGGAFKFASLARSKLGVEFDVVKEMDAVVKGLNLVLQVAPESIFTVNPSTGEHLPHQLESAGDTFEPFPYLLINVGSGISFIKCLDRDGTHVRVGGTPIGGATFWGLTRTLTNLTSWEEVLEIMRLDGPGDNRNVDLLVGDIYGYNADGLPPMLSSDMVASSFGKFGTERFYEATRIPPTALAAPESTTDMLEPLSPNITSPNVPSNISSRPGTAANSIDIVRSLLHMIAGNVTQLAYLHSKIHGVKNVFFAGGFVRENPIIWSKISATMQYWSSGACNAHFLEHDGYLGALGSLTMDESSMDSA